MRVMHLHPRTLHTWHQLSILCLFASPVAPSYSQIDSVITRSEGKLTPTKEWQKNSLQVVPEQGLNSGELRAWDEETLSGKHACTREMKNTQRIEK
jgi:hypothetical protein